MGLAQRHAWCKYCGRYTLHQKPRMGFGVGLLLTLLTAGLFIPIWIVMGLLDAFKPFRCQGCGKGKLV